MEIGLTFTSKITVSEEHLAINIGSGDLPVLGTPAMLALMENAAMKAVAPYLPNGSTTVGSRICSSHIKPTALGKEVTATAVLTACENRKLVFKVTASDEGSLIGEGEHIRYIVDKEKFLSKL